jgi:hypothetical protein
LNVVVKGIVFLTNVIHRDVAKPLTLHGGCRHVSTNISYNFDQVVRIFPENVVDGGGGGGGGGRLVKTFSGLKQA